MRERRGALLDEVLGGVTPGLPVALCGPSGSGRTVFCLQQVYAALARGESAAFVTAEPARLVLQQGQSMGLAFEPALRERRLVLLELEPDSPATTRVHGGEVFAGAVLEAAPDAQLVAIDPLTILTSELIDEREMRAVTRGLFGPLASAGCAALVTVEREALEESPVLVRALKDACGVFAEISFDEGGGHVLRVTKSRTAGCSDRPVAFRVGRGGPYRDDDGDDGDGGDDNGGDRVVAPAPGAPRHPPEAPPIAAKPLARSPAAGAAADASETRRRLLVVEDEAVTRTMMVDWLSPLYDVAVAADGFAAVSSALQGRPDLVLLDLHLPRASGYEVLRVLRGAGVTLPVLVVSGQLARASDRIRALVLGATDLMPKPVQHFELLHKVDALLRYASGPDLGVDVQDAEALLGEESARRQLDEPAFRERLARACRFGEQFALASTLVAIEAPSADALDALSGVAEERLRPEDALLLVGKQRALLLLVACATESAEPVVKRLGECLVESGTSPCGLRWRSAEARPRSDESNWEDLFQTLDPWPAVLRA